MFDDALWLPCTCSDIDPVHSQVPLPLTNTSWKYQPSTYNTLGVEPVTCTPLRIGILTREFQYFT